MPDARDVTGLVRHARAGRKPGGYRVIDRLALESLEHLPGGFPVDGLTARDRFEQREQRLCRGRVDEPLLECLRILEIAQHAHAVGSERVYAGADVLDAKPVHQQVRGEIAADRDHELAELSQRARASARPIQIPFRVVVGVQRERRAIDQTVELILNAQGIVELQLSLPCLAIELDQDRHLHGAGGVKRLVGTPQPLRPAVERPKRHRDVRSALLDRRFDGGNRGGEPRVRRGGAVPPEEGSERKQQSPPHQARHVRLGQLSFSSSP